MKNRILNFIGFRHPIAEKLDNYHYYKLYQLCIIVFFTAFVSASLIALFVSQFFNDFSIWAIIGICTIWFLLVLLIDRSIVTANSKQDNYLFLIRLGIIFGFVIIHSSVIDLQFFNNDIKTHLNVEKQVHIGSIQNRYTNRLRILNTEITNLKINNNRFADEIIKERKEVDAEVNNGSGTNRIGGYGKIATYKDSSFVQKKKLINNKIQNNQSLIQEKEQIRVDLLEEQRQQISELTSFEESGVISRLSALHKVIFLQENNVMSIVFFIAFLIIGITLESAPLILKYTNRESVLAYHELSENQNEIFKTRAQNQINEQLTKEGVAHKIEKQSIIKTLETKMQFSFIEKKMYQFFSHMEHQEKSLDEIIKMDANAKKKHSKEYYKNYYYPKVIAPLLEEFVKEKNQ